MADEFDVKVGRLVPNSTKSQTSSEKERSKPEHIEKNGRLETIPEN